MQYLHTMVRVSDLDASLHFYCDLLGLKEVRRKENEKGRNFGHLAYRVDDIYALCQYLQDNGVTINRPPRDGHMAFVKSPDGISVELLQKGEALEPQEPWVSMENSGSW